MGEFFVRRFKRDYVYLPDRWRAANVLRDLSRWFDDYNRMRPHKRLRMLSPVEFRNSQVASSPLDPVQPGATSDPGNLPHFLVNVRWRLR